MTLTDLAPIRMDVQAAIAEQTPCGHGVDQGARRGTNLGMLRRIHPTALRGCGILQSHAKRIARALQEPGAAGRREIQAGNYPEAVRLLEEARTGYYQYRCLFVAGSGAVVIDRPTRAEKLLAQAKTKYDADDLTGAQRQALDVNGAESRKPHPPCWRTFEAGRGMERRCRLKENVDCPGMVLKPLMRGFHLTEPRPVPWSTLAPASARGPGKADEQRRRQREREIFEAVNFRGQARQRRSMFGQDDAEVRASGGVSKSWRRKEDRTN
jgi:hypothetical protein